MSSSENLFVVPSILLSPITYPFHTAAQTCSSCIPALASSFICRSCYARPSSRHPHLLSSKCLFARLSKNVGVWVWFVSLFVSILLGFILLCFCSCFVLFSFILKEHIRISLFYFIYWEAKIILLPLTAKAAFCGDKVYASLKDASDCSPR